MKKISPKSKSFHCRPRENESEKLFPQPSFRHYKYCKRAGWDTAKILSGHSLRASSITALYDHRFDDNSVKKFSSHRSDLEVLEYQRSEKSKRQTTEISSRPAVEARITLQEEDIIEEDEELELVMSQIVQKDGFEFLSTVEYEMPQIDIPNTFSFTGAVFNNCTINFK